MSFTTGIVKSLAALVGTLVHVGDEGCFLRIHSDNRNS